MFNIETLIEPAAKAMKILGEADNGKLDLEALKASLVKFRQTWLSPECTRYIESFASAASVAGRRELPNGELTQSYFIYVKTLVESGNIVARSANEDKYDRATLIMGLSGVYTTLNQMGDLTRQMNEAIVNGEGA